MRGAESMHLEEGLRGRAALPDDVDELRPVRGRGRVRAMSKVQAMVQP